MTPPVSSDRPAVRLSAILIVRDEAHNLPRCLSALSFCDEIVVVDSGSADASREIAHRHGARVFEQPWLGFGLQKNAALSRARGDWILSIDADEVVTEPLRVAIQAAVASSDAAGWRLRRTSAYLGRWMRHGGWGDDRVLRLFRRAAGRFSDDAVHERVVLDGRVEDLDGVLLHYSFPDAETVLRKVDAYSTAGARAAQARGQRSSPARAVLGGLWSFLRTYLLRLGFLDGWRGLMLAVSNAEGTYWRHIKLWLLEQPREPAPPGKRS